MDYGLERDFIAEFNSWPTDWFAPKKQSTQPMPDRGPGGRFLPGWVCVTKRDSRGRFARN